MRVVLFRDNSVSLAIPRFCELLNGLCATVEFVPGAAAFDLPLKRIQSPSTDDTLPEDVREEIGPFDLACFATLIPYDNNHFFDSSGKGVIVSFSDWNGITDLPLSNGFAFFIASIICHGSGIGSVHESSTGCINDFWWDKTDVDVGMRAAFICGSCLASTSADSGGAIDDVKAILNAVSEASRRNGDILDSRRLQVDAQEDVFDVFLCHNSDDKPAIRKVNSEMKEWGIRTWFDEEQLRPGTIWQTELERVIEGVRSACVFVGDSGFGPWHANEARAFLNLIDTEQRPVIPVLLPNASKAPQLPVFLHLRSWVDLRDDYRMNMNRLLAFLAEEPYRPQGDSPMGGFPFRG
jgi:hypothetical protein